MEDDVEVTAIPDVRVFLCHLLLINFFRAGAMVQKTIGRY